MNEIKNNEKNRNLYDFDVEEKKKRRKKKTKENLSNEKDLGNEIIIGVTKIPEKEDYSKNAKTRKKSKNVEKKNKKKNKPRKDKEQKKKHNIGKVLKWTSLFIVVIGVIVFAMISPK